MYGGLIYFSKKGFAYNDEEINLLIYLIVY